MPKTVIDTLQSSTVNDEPQPAPARDPRETVFVQTLGLMLYRRQLAAAQAAKPAPTPDAIPALDAVQ